MVKEGTLSSFNFGYLKNSLELVFILQKIRLFAFANFVFLHILHYIRILQVIWLIFIQR